MIPPRGTGAALRYDTVSFLSDYGLGDEFVGVVKSVIRSLAPEVVVVDITHDIAPHDVRAGGLALARSAQYLVPGVVLAVVDPGVGGKRRAVAVEVGGGTSVLVGPDNGLLAPAVAMVGGATRVVELTAEKYHLRSPGPTFAGRDVFAPVAAHLCSGVGLEDVGTPIPMHSLTPGVVPVSRTGGDRIDAEVLWIDRFGNLQLNLDPSDIDPMGDVLRITAGGVGRNARRVNCFSDVSTGDLGILVDSYGLAAVAVNRGSAAMELNCKEGDSIIVESGESALATPVQLQPRPPEVPA
ncbi:SAM hydrolase/SAM-dependent halogenase family protein [Candidatus Poriferisocius sp.]|uniref:SAM hydrolase/SAM-dependent halogenase family protein n=1 Tax=Candidatus Poriferisocius sp. TaxID=3101276 RepID=UPI003B028DCB